MSDTGEVVVVTTAVDDEAAARRMSVQAVSERLAACAKRRPVASTYRWHDDVVEDDEFVVEFVSTRHRVDALTAWLRAAHPYEVPEIVVVVADASADYARWADDATSGAAPGVRGGDDGGRSGER